MYRAFSEGLADGGMCDSSVNAALSPLIYCSPHFFIAFLEGKRGDLTPIALNFRLLVNVCRKQHHPVR